MREEVNFLNYKSNVALRFFFFFNYMLLSLPLIPKSKYIFIVSIFVKVQGYFQVYFNSFIIQLLIFSMEFFSIMFAFSLCQNCNKL